MDNIYYCNIRNVSWEQVQKNLSILSVEDAKRILYMRKETDKCLSLVGRMLLLYSLKIQGVWDKTFLPEISYSLHKRPFIVDLTHDFNIAHSGDIVVCYLSEHGRVGIDVEKIMPINFNDYIDVFSEYELEKINKSTAPLLEFYRSWTGKEAIIKANGSGFFLDTKKIFVHNNECIVDNIKFFASYLTINNQYAFCAVSNKISEKSVVKLLIDDNASGFEVYCSSKIR